EQAVEHAYDRESGQCANKSRGKRVALPRAARELEDRVEVEHGKKHETETALFKVNMKKHVLGVPGQVIAIAREEPELRPGGEVSVADEVASRAVDECHIVDVDDGPRLLHVEG